MTGRLRNLFPFWSGAGRVYPATGGNADAVLPVPSEPDEHAAVVRELLALTEGVRQALISAGYFHVGEGQVVAAVQHLAGEYVQTVAELRALKLNPAAMGDRERRAEVAELRRLLAASPEQAHRNCLDLSDRLAELRRERDDLDKRLAEREGRAAQVNIIDREGSPWTPC